MAVTEQTQTERLREARVELVTMRSRLRDAEDHERAAKGRATYRLGKASGETSMAAQDRYVAATLHKDPEYVTALGSLRLAQEAHDVAQGALDSELDERRRLEYELAVENKGVEFGLNPEALGLLQRHVQMMGYLGEAARRPR